MLHKTRAIVLHQIKYGESSLIITFYTEQFGRITCMVSGVRSKKARTPATLFQPLTLLEIDIYYRQNREIQRLKEAWCPFHFNSIPFDITKSTIALFLAEVLFHSLREEESNPSLFSFLYHSFQLLDAKDEGTVNFHLWFMLHFTKYLGISIYKQPLKEAEEAFSTLEVFSALPAGAEAAMKLLLENPQGMPDFLLLSKPNRNILLERIIRYYALYLDGFLKLKSFAVLQEVFK